MLNQGVLSFVCVLSALSCPGAPGHKLPGRGGGMGPGCEGLPCRPCSSWLPVSSWPLRHPDTRAVFKVIYRPACVTGLTSLLPNTSGHRELGGRHAGGSASQEASASFCNFSSFGHVQKPGVLGPFTFNWGCT